jgi:hypothetical protein
MKELHTYEIKQKHVQRIKEDARINISTAQTASHRSIDYYLDDIYSKTGIFSLKVIEIKNAKHLLLVLIGSEDEIITYPITSYEFSNIPIEYDKIYDPVDFDEILLNYFQSIYNFENFIKNVRTQKAIEDITAWANTAA